MKTERKNPTQKKGNTNIIQTKEGKSFVKPKGDANSFSKPTTSGKQNKSLPSKLQSNMETSLGQDFSNVGIHTNSQKAVQMKAKAFTQSEQIHFAPGEFNPGSTSGQNLIGHEFTHIAQQRAGVVKPTKALKKGEMINDDRGLESEADNFGRKAARGEVVSKYRSASLGMRSSVRTAQAKSNVMQMAMKESHFGKFYDKTYTAQTNGVNMKVEFEPTKANATKIGLTQSIKETAGGNPDYIEPTQEGRIVPSGPGAGYRMDRFSTRNNPIYGANSLANGDGLDKTQVNNANNTYELGHRFEKTPGNWDSKNAWLIDRPRGSSMNDAGQVFETTALGLDGAMKDTYFGSVSWGWTRDSKGKYKILDFKLVSKGAPSQNFFAAAEQFNNSRTQGTILTKNNNTQVYKSNAGVRTQWFTVNKDTPVTIIGSPVGTTVVYSNIRVTHGTTQKDGYIKVQDLRDKGDGGETANLPIHEIFKVNPATSMRDIDSGTIVQIPENTRVRVVNWSTNMGNYVEIEIVDGDLTGKKGYLHNDYMRDEKTGGFAPLGPGIPTPSPSGTRTV